MQTNSLKAADVAKKCGVSTDTVKAITDEYSSSIPSHSIGRIKIYEEKAVELISKISEMKQRGCTFEEISGEIFGGKAVKKSTRERMTEEMRKSPSGVGKVSGDKGGVNAGVENSGSSAPHSSSVSSSASSVVNETVGSVQKFVEGAAAAAEKTVGRVIERSKAADSEMMDKFGAVDLRVSRLATRIGRIETEVAEMKSKSDERFNEIKEILNALDKRSSISDEWINSFEKTLDDYREFQNGVNDSLTVSISEINSEISNLKKPFWKK